MIRPLQHSMTILWFMLKASWNHYIYIYTYYILYILPFKPQDLDHRVNDRRYRKWYVVFAVFCPPNHGIWNMFMYCNLFFGVPFRDVRRLSGPMKVQTIVPYRDQYALQQDQYALLTNYAALVVEDCGWVTRWWNMLKPKTPHCPMGSDWSDCLFWCSCWEPAVC